MKAELVSVILPTYNRMAVLPRAVRSVLAQTHAELELIVVDDASSDDTQAFLSGLGDPRVRCLHLGGRGGAAPARNAGIRAARGELIAFQDSDDEWRPRKLELQLTLLRQAAPEVGWIGGAYRNGNRVVSSQALVRGEGYGPDLAYGEPFVTPTWLVRRACLEQAGLFDTAMPCLEDWDLIFKLAGVCRFLAVEEEVLERYGSADSLFGDLAKRRAGMEVMLRRHRRFWLEHPRRYARWCSELARLHALCNDPAGCRPWLLEALRHDRLYPRAMLMLAAGAVHGKLLARLSRSRLAIAH
jgi:glycosyltransferase involved in cell wall biosynthesis